MKAVLHFFSEVWRW